MRTLKSYCGIVTLVIGVLIKGSICQEDVELTVEGASEVSGVYEAEAGSNVTIHCKVLLSAKQGSSVIINKITADDDARTVLINTLTKRPPNDTPYTFGTTETDQDETTHLFLTNVQGEDSGDYTCGIGSELPEEITLSVDSPPRSTKLYLDDVEASDGDAGFDPPVTKTIRCVAEGSSPAAAVTLFLDGEDITKTKLQDTVVSRKDAEDTLEGQLNLTEDFAEKKLHCQAERPSKSDEPMKSAYATLKSGELKADQLPIEEKTAQLPVEEKAAQLPVEDEAAHLPAEEKAAQLPLLGKAAQLPAEEEAAQLPVSGEVAQLPAEEEAAQLPAEDNAAKLQGENIENKDIDNIQEDNLPHSNKNDTSVPELAPAADDTPIVEHHQPSKDDGMKPAPAESTVESKKDMPKPELHDSPANASTNMAEKDSGKEGDAPVFENCSKEVMVGFRKPLSVTCKVTSGTDLTETYFYWKEKGGNKIMLTPREQVHGLPAEHSDEAKTWERNGNYFGFVYQHDGSTMMELQTERMNTQMYREHTMVAENMYGAAEYKFTIVQDPSAPIIYISGAESLCWCYIALLTPIFIVLLQMN